MRVMIVDDEQFQLERLRDDVAAVLPDCELSCYTDPQEALSGAEKDSPEIAFLDIQMPDMDGIELAKRLKRKNPRVNLVFVTGYYEEYVFDAVPLHFSGYLQKPVTVQKIQNEVNNLRYPLVRHESPHRIKVRCFGDFEIFVDDKPMAFSRTRSKEILAYLVDRKGARVSGAKICAVVYEDQKNDNSIRSSFRTCIADIRETLHRVGADDVLIKGRDSYAIDVSRIECDYYAWCRNEAYAVHDFRGEYMSQYSWAEETLGDMLNGSV